MTSNGLKTEIIYVNDACPDKSYVSVLREWEGKRNQLRGEKVGKILLHRANAGFGPACHTGAQAALGEYLIFLNADCTVTPNWVEPLYNLIKSDSSIGIVGNLQLKSNGTIDSAGSYWTGSSFEHIGRSVYNGKRTSPILYKDAPASLKVAGERQMVTGCCFIISKQLYGLVGGFDREYLVGYWGDADLNMKVRTLGYKVFYEPKSKIYHVGSHSKAGGHSYQTSNRGKFHRDWVRPGVLKMLNDNLENPRLDTSKDKVVVYTAIVNDYDRLMEKQAKKGADFKAFLDNPNVTSKTWEILPAADEFDDPNRNAKVHKILSHKYFPDYEYSLWIDGNVNLKVPIRQIIPAFLRDVDLAVFKHPERHCIYDEADACIARRLDSSEVIRNQVNQYKRQGYPVKNGLAECTVILRRHTPAMKKFNELWWKEICRGSKRDQISFPIIAKKTGLKYNFFPGSLRKSDNLIFYKQGAHVRGN
jgi:GT2 family glycosyltransferase